MDNNESDNKELEKSKNPALEIQKKELEQMDEMAKDIIRGADDANEQSDEMYQYMKDLIDIEADKSDATRQMMGKALEIKLGANNQKLELLKMKAKLLNPGKAQTSVNINLGDYDTKKGSNTNDMISVVESLKEDIDE